METQTTLKAVNVWALTDGRAGNAAQALGLAEAIGRARPVHIAVHAAEPGRLAALLPAAVSLALGVLPGWPEAGYSGVPAGLPDLVIGAGRRIAPLVAALGRRGAKTVQVLDPQMPHSAFDAVVVPEHDGVTGPRVLTSLGAPGRITPARVAEAANAWADRVAPLPKPRLAVLIGGPGRMASWEADTGARLVTALTTLAETHSLLVTASRRTDPAVMTALETALDPARHLLHAGTGENPYPAILGLADAVLVTEDSVNMASEAASTGLPVHIFRTGGASDKAQRFHTALAARGIARDFTGQIERWSYRPLAEADRLAAEILARLSMA
ncbi:MAG: mitochondrial fission ELM1 family protein [Pseudomonadota bacterium]